MSDIALQKVFLSSKIYAVVGASKDQTKFGTKILKWYQERGLKVQPIHPKETHLEGLETIPSVAELSAPTETSLSVVTPPKITLSVLQTALPLGVPVVWIQPGAADESVVEWVKENGMEGRVIHGGPCILRDADELRSNL
ncbi:NAD-P-binding protein [Mycena galericulata]|nr:NAD-P-binding protein [Mycena galericulata]